MPSFRLSRLLPVVCAALLSSAPLALAADVYEGVLNIIWQDPRPGSGAATEVRYWLALPDGRTLALDMNGRQSEALTLMGRTVLVNGRSDAGAAATAGLPAADGLVVDSIAVARDGAASGATTSATALGTKKVIFLLLKFADDAAGPPAPAVYTKPPHPHTPPPGSGVPPT